MPADVFPQRFSPARWVRFAWLLLASFSTTGIAGISPAPGLPAGHQRRTPECSALLMLSALQPACHAALAITTSNLVGIGPGGSRVHFVFRLAVSHIADPAAAAGVFRPIIQLFNNVWTRFRIRARPAFHAERTGSDLSLFRIPVRVVAFQCRIPDRPEYPDSTNGLA